MSLVIAVAVAAQLLVAAPEIPNPSITPGYLNSKVDVTDPDGTVCIPGYTATVRPPSSYTDALKLKQMTEYNLSDKNPSHYEQDHFIPLELGGDPTDPRNEWPQTRFGDWTAHMKDVLENTLHRLVCTHKMALGYAQSIIMKDWRIAYQRYVKIPKIARKKK